jgi:hypothetical protein
MKSKWLLLSLPFFLCTLIVSAAEKTVTLKGLITVQDIKKAVVGVAEPARNSSQEYVLAEGQKWNGVEVTKIDAKSGTVDVNLNGEKRSLVWENDDAGSTNKSGNTAVPSIRLRSVTSQTAIDLYADGKERTVLQHPQLGAHQFSLVSNPASKAEAAAVFEKMFDEQSVATIPDGEHFVMIVPFALTNKVTPRSQSLVTTNALVPKFSMNLREAPAQLVLQVYADFVHKKIVNLRDGNGASGFSFVQTTALSREEICYALETEFAWRGIQFVPDGSGNLKIERTSARK